MLHETLLCRLDGLYQVLLGFYPSRFRRRFGAEMLQIFQDCCRSEREAGRLLFFCLQTLKDAALSIPAEWRREIERPDCELDYTGLADAFMITIVVGTNLIGWGGFGAAVVLHLTLPGIMQYWSNAAALLIGIFTVPLAALIGALFALVVARLGRRELPHIRA